MPKVMPFMSVVVNCLNGEATLGAALDSLLRQTYPRNRYEIIVVDDGSTDNTAAIAKSYRRVRYIGLGQNRGIPDARNAGLKAAKGTIFVGFDDDCIAESTWLEEIAKGYAKDNPIGVGGRFIEPQPVRGITNRYISASDSNIGARAAGAEHMTKNPLRRLWRYLLARLPNKEANTEEKVRVTELYGANGSYPVSVLKRVGGWRSDMFWIEDRDLSRRIVDAYPKRSFYIMPKALVTHGGGQTLLQYLLRPYKRGPINLAFHRKNHIPPPLFPFPVLFVAVCAAVSVLNPLLLPAIILIVPYVLYFWWPIKAIRLRQVGILIFPYLQLAEESMVLAGLARGYWQLFLSRLARLIRPIRGALHFIATLLLIAGTSYALLHTQTVWLRSAIALPYLLFIPGYCIWLAITSHQKKQSVFRTFSYCIGLSLLLLMLCGLLLNEAFVGLGSTNPLSPLPLVYTIGLAVALCATAAFIRHKNNYRLFVCHMPNITRTVLVGLPVLAIGLSLPIISAMGAVTLNNGGTNRLALCASGAVAALMLVLVFLQSTLKRFNGWFLFSMCLSILLGTSLRGWNITGHDVMQEFQVFRLTLSHSTWHMSYYHDAYMACLSITILPTILQKLTGIRDVYIFKFVFQLIFAIFAPIMYETLTMMVSRRKALLATFLFISFPTFLTDIMMLNRQEMALLFLALSLMTGLDKQLGWRLKSLLGFMFLLGMVLSHYSTSYVALGALSITLVLAAVWRWSALLIFHKQTLPYSQLTGLYHAAVVAGALCALVAWGSIATQTSNNIYLTLQSVTASASSRTLTIASLPHPSTATSPLARYLAAAKASRQLQANEYYSPTIVAHYPLVKSVEYVVSPSPTLSLVHAQSLPLTSIYNLLRTGYGLAIEGLVGLGILIVFIYKSQRKLLPMQYIFFGAGGLVLLALQATLPSAINYSLTRMIQETLLVLALPMILAGSWIFWMLHIPQRVGECILAIILVTYFVILSGLLPAVTGGFKPVLPLSNSGFYYEAYYTHDDEITASQWLSSHAPVGSRVYSDEFMRRKIIAYAGIFAQPSLAPVAIPQDSYVFLGYGNTKFNQVVAYDGASLIYFQPPIDFLNANKNTIYSSTDVTIYK